MQEMSWLDLWKASAPAIVETVVFVVAAALIARLVVRLVKRGLLRLRRHVSLSYEAAQAITRSVALAMTAFAGLIILNMWGISVGGLWTVFVSAFAVIGVGFLAVWTMVSNITASLFLSIWRPFHLGYTVEVFPENLKGKVVARNLMFTALRQADGGTVFVPNNLFFQKLFRVTHTDEQFPFEIN